MTIRYKPEALEGILLQGERGEKRLKNRLAQLHVDGEIVDEGSVVEMHSKAQEYDPSVDVVVFELVCNNL